MREALAPGAVIEPEEKCQAYDHPYVKNDIACRRPVLKKQPAAKNARRHINQQPNQPCGYRPYNPLQKVFYILLHATHDNKFTVTNVFPCFSDESPLHAFQSILILRGTRRHHAN